MDDKQRQYIVTTNRSNPYVDITPVELNLGLPIIKYGSYLPEEDEVVLYATPARTFKDQNAVLGYRGYNVGSSGPQSKWLTFNDSMITAQAIRGKVRGFSSGDLIITSKRIVFIGTEDNFSIELPNIIAFKPLNNRSFVVQDTEKSANILIDNPVIANYAISFVQYAIDNRYNAEVVMNEKNKMTPEQKEYCAKFSQESIDKLKENDRIKKEKRKENILKNLNIIVPVVVLYLFLAYLLGILHW